MKGLHGRMRRGRVGADTDTMLARIVDEDDFDAGLPAARVDETQDPDYVIDLLEQSLYDIGRVAEGTITHLSRVSDLYDFLYSERGNKYARKSVVHLHERDQKLNEDEINLFICGYLTYLSCTTEDPRKSQVFLQHVKEEVVKKESNRR